MQRTQLLPQTKPDTMSRARAIQLHAMLATWAQDWRKPILSPPQLLGKATTPTDSPAYESVFKADYEAKCIEYDVHGMRHVVLALLRHHPRLLLVEQASQPVARVISWVLSFTPISTALPTGHLMRLAAEIHGREYIAADGGLCLRAAFGEMRAIPGFTALLDAMTLPVEVSIRSNPTISQADLDSLFADAGGLRAVMGFLAARRHVEPPEWPWVLGLFADLDGATDTTLSAYGLVTPLHEEELGGGRRKLDPSKITAAPAEMAMTMVAFLLQLRSADAPGQENLQWALLDFAGQRRDGLERGALAGLYDELLDGSFVLPRGVVSKVDFENMARQWSADREARVAMAQNSWSGVGGPPDAGAAPTPLGDPHGAEHCQHLWLGDHPDLVAILPAAIREGLVDAPVLAVLERMEPRLRERPAPQSRRSLGQLLAAAAGAVTGVVRRGSTR